MKFTVLGSGAGLPSKDRNTQSFVIDCVLEYNEYILIDAGEALQLRAEERRWTAGSAERASWAAAPGADGPARACPRPRRAAVAGAAEEEREGRRR